LRNWERCQPGHGDFEIDRENPHASPMPPSQAALCALLATGALIAEPARRHQLRNTCLLVPHSSQTLALILPPPLHPHPLSTPKNLFPITSANAAHPFLATGALIAAPARRRKHTKNVGWSRCKSSAKASCDLLLEVRPNCGAPQPWGKAGWWSAILWPSERRTCSGFTRRKVDKEHPRVSGTEFAAHDTSATNFRAPRMT